MCPLSGPGLLLEAGLTRKHTGFKTHTHPHLLCNLAFAFQLHHTHPIQIQSPSIVAGPQETPKSLPSMSHASPGRCSHQKSSDSSQMSKIWVVASLPVEAIRQRLSELACSARLRTQAEHRGLGNLLMSCHPLPLLLQLYSQCLNPQPQPRALGRSAHHFG